MNDRLAAFDPVKFKQTTRAQWETAAEAWDRWGPFMAAGSDRPPTPCWTSQQIGPGSHVLDVAAGAGEQTLTAARRVGPGGHVLATDISPGILRYARQAATPPAWTTSRRWSSTASSTTR